MNAEPCSDRQPPKNDKDTGEGSRGRLLGAARAAPKLFHFLPSEKHFEVCFSVHVLPVFKRFPLKSSRTYLCRVWPQMPAGVTRELVGSLHGPHGGWGVRAKPSGVASVRSRGR